MSIKSSRNWLGRMVMGALFVTLVGNGIVSLPVGTAQEDAGKLSREDAKKLKNPVSYTAKSIAQGKTVFMRYCTECHGSDGKAQIDVIANATDLTDPEIWKSGTTTGEIFRSIRDGAGVSMPPYKNQIRKEEDLWHLVNFTQSLWPESARPKLQEEKPSN
jgi:mono/diheme cytochrome c family protein